MEDAENCAERKVQMLVLERRDESRNMSRFYVLAIEATLFGDSRPAPPASVRDYGVHSSRNPQNSALASLMSVSWF